MAPETKTKKTTRQFLVDEKGKRTAIVLPIKEYEALLEAWEDQEDIRLAEEARKEGGGIPLEKLEKRLRAEGKLR